MESNFTGLNNSRQTSVALERMNDVAAHMVTQYTDYKNAGSSAMEIMTSLYDNMETIVDYFKQTFAARGIPTENIYCEKNEATKSIMLTILWQKIGFTIYPNNQPLALFKNDSSKMNCYRILATKGDCINVITENTDFNKCILKLLEIEIASLYVPADKKIPCEMRVRHLRNEILSINHQFAAKEFFLKVIEYTCGGGNLHIEREFSSINF